MIAPAAKPPDPVVSYHIGADAEPGNVVPSLAALLIGADRRRREREAKGDGNQVEQEGAG